MPFVTYGQSAIVIDDAADGAVGPPELADVRRLGRRALRGIVRAARADLDAALEELNATRNAMTRALLGGGRVSSAGEGFGPAGNAPAGGGDDEDW